MKPYTILLIFLLHAFPLFSEGQVRLPRLVSDSMILQRDMPVKVWGWASPGEHIEIHFNNQVYKTISDAAGNWKVIINPTGAGGPYEMVINGRNEVRLKEILMGDVWLCSGQSNMELSMQRVKDKYPDVIASSANPFIRQFNVSTRHAFGAPESDFAAGRWEAANPESLLRFTAVGYFFARDLYNKYKVPIGLIKAAVGGSPAEAWISEASLKSFPGYLETAMKFKNKAFVDSIRAADQAGHVKWYSNVWQLDAGMQEPVNWMDPAYDATSWKTMKVPGYWEEVGIKNFNGVVWFRKEIMVPAHMTGVPARLYLGNIIDRDSVYINGTFAGTTGYQYPPRKYDLAPTILKPGKNIITVRVINYSGRGGFVLDKPYQLTAGDQSIDLRGDWQFKVGMQSPPIPPTVTFHYQPGSLYNGMIHPIVPYALKGILWYQGESNTDRAIEYRSLMKSLILDWRHHWQQGATPFLYVQLANFMEAKEQPSESNWALLRESQMNLLELPNTAMAVTIDLGEWNDIHPLNKEDVGRRLALAAQKIAYHENLVHSGPIYQKMKIKGNRVHISFRHPGKGLVLKDEGSFIPVSIAGADGKFRWANAKIRGKKLVVWHDDIQKPIAVRYAWADNPRGALLYNKEGLPASPFRTDHPLQ
jgi:sialate O-acetylesterase